MSKPMSASFQHVVYAMDMKLGYDWMAHHEAPDSFELACKSFKRNEQIIVWDGASDNTIFSAPYYNHAFRAWHDWCHVVGGHDFSLEGEKAAAAMQKHHLRMFFPDHPDLPLWLRIIDLEVSGQAEHFHATGAFPEDQRTWMVERLRAEGFDVS